MLKRKLKKLIRDPKLFISDMMINNAKKKEIINKKIDKGYYSYTVVSAVYNSAIYLDDYFKSFIKQNLNFKNNITLVLVDDGSSDNSAEVIKKWQLKFPNNIKYIYKENGGQASARNLGLEHVITDWVTFIDSDDFVSPNYFSSIDELLAQNNDLKMVCCNQIYYFEEDNTYIDRHPLNYRFKNKKTILPLNDLGRHMQFSAPLAFFHVQSIPKSLKFDETLKPTFEDGKFVAHYILANQSSQICFYETPRYYNRKRSDKSSTMDNAWFNKGQYGIVLENGYIPTLKNYIAELGHVPKFMQRTILWEMLRLVKHLVNQEHNVSFLTAQEKDKFLALMDETFSYIDSETILSFELGSCGFSRQVGMLGCFKKEAPGTQVVYIEKYDYDKKLLLVRYFTCKESLEHFDLDGEDIIPSFEKITSRSFLSRDFLLEKRMWLPINNIAQGILTVKIDGNPTSINYFGKKHRGKVNISDLKKKVGNKKEVWLLMDRDDSAGDNAEFLYDYCKDNTDIECHFVLSKTSHDWNRLKGKGFNLIDHNSNEHKQLLLKCTKAISSHVGPMINPFTDVKENYANIFLQHGVTKDDISNWINNCKIDLMITATDPEYYEITKDKSPYLYGHKEIKKTGFPRFDSLLQINQSSGNKKILIMPTWRKSISGVFVKKGSSERVLNPNFVETDYSKSINSLLNNKRLDELAKKHNLDVIFCPHPNMRPYLNHFKKSESVRIADINESIHDFLKESALLVTDYSSVAFDFAYMKKPLCYYQFDEDTFFSGEHTYGRGYYDYREHGFGPVLNREDDLISEIESIVKNRFEIVQNKYLENIEKTFSSIDQDNCKRTFDALIEMSEPSNHLNIQILERFANQAFINKNWELSISRWRKLLENDNSNEIACLKLAESLREAGSVNEAIEILTPLNFQNSVKLNEIHSRELAKNYMACHQWEIALTYWEQVQITNPVDHAMYVKCLAEINSHSMLNSYLPCTSHEYETSLDIIIKARCHMSYSNWFEAINVIEENIHSFEDNEFIEFKPDLILSRCYREVGNYEEAHKQLTKYESYAKDDIQHRYEIAYLAFKTAHYSKVIIQHDRVGIDKKYLSHELNLIYIRSLIALNKHKEALDIIEILPKTISESDEFVIQTAEILSHLKQWDNCIILWLQLLGKSDQAEYKLAEAYRMLGMIDEGVTLILKEGVRPPKCFSEWVLRAELSQLSGLWSDVEYCWSSILRNYPEKSTEKSWSFLYNAQLMNALALNKNRERIM